MRTWHLLIIAPVAVAALAFGMTAYLLARPIAPPQPPSYFDPGYGPVGVSSTATAEIDPSQTARVAKHAPQVPSASSASAERSSAAPGAASAVSSSAGALGPVLVPSCGGSAAVLCPVPGYSGVYAEAGSVYPVPTQPAPLQPGVRGWLCAVERMGNRRGC